MTLRGFNLFQNVQFAPEIRQGLSENFFVERLNASQNQLVKFEFVTDTQDELFERFKNHLLFPRVLSQPQYDWKYTLGNDECQY